MNEKKLKRFLDKWLFVKDEEEEKEFKEELEEIFK